MILLDTSALIDSLSGPKRSAPTLRSFIDRKERIALPTLALYEWWRGPRLEQELAAQEALLPADEALSFGPREARIAAGLYRRVARARGRELDLAIAACALSHEAALWTLNEKDFSDIPDLRLAR